MRHIKQILLVSVIFPLLAVATSSCSDDVSVPGYTGGGASAMYNEKGNMVLEVTAHMPGMSVASSRAMGNEPDFENLGLYMLVFEEGEGLRQFAKLSDKSVPEADPEHHHEGLVKFNVELAPNDKNVVIHLIATNQSNFSGQIHIGMEERVINSLYTDNGNEAYWQRIAPGSNIPSAEEVEKGGVDADNANRIKALLSHVPMIRNFSRVSVTLSEEALENFNLTGLYVFNTVDRGSVAPFVASNPIGERYIKYYNDPEPGGGYTGKSYAEISAAGHVGTVPSGVKLLNKIDQGENITTKSAGSPVYFYERPARDNSTERTYVILKGTFRGKTTYYKIDLGYVSDDELGQEVGIFTYYNLLRNFDYRINLSHVESEGYGTLEEAAKGAVFNNFSASVEARNMKSISDGDDMIFVNFTSYVFTRNDEWVNLDAQYRTGIAGGTGGTVDNSELKYKLGGPDDVIKNVTGPVDNDSIGSRWKRWRVYGNDPGPELKQQTLYVYRGKKDNGEYGLYRVITFFSQLPWAIKRIDTFPGLWESMDDIPGGEWGTDHREVGQYKGSPLTLFFELPGGIPQALFPLDFVIESDRQNIQNAYQGNAVVQSVPAAKSLFYNDWTIEQPKTSRIQYVKTVTWENYYGEWSDELVGNGSTIVRCRFLTITDLNQDVIGQGDDGTTSETHLRVWNPYIGQLVNGTFRSYMEDGFKRDSKTSDPSPRFWDFSSGVWDEVILTLAETHQQLGGANSTVTNTIDELSVIEGAAGSMTSGTDDNGRFIQTSNAGDKFQRYLLYGAPVTRQIRVVVTVDSNAPTPKITITAVPGSTPPAAPSDPTKTTVNGELTEYEFIFTVGSTIEEFYMNVQPANGNATKFYRIDFYPRWDEMSQDGD